MKGKRTEIKDIETKLKEKDGTLISEFTKNGKRFVIIRCNKDDHEWSVSLSGLMFSRNSWCKVCYNRKRIKPIELSKVIELVESKGFKLNTKTHIDFWSDIELYCPKHNITWTTSYGTLVRGDTNCIMCGHDAISFEEFNKIITDNGATFVRKIKNGCPTRNVVLRCNKHNHEWKTNSADIKAVNRWCTYCKRDQRKTSYEKIKAAVESKDGQLLTENCVGSLTKILVQCKAGHQWESYYDNINQGYWCPECKLKTQNLLHAIIKEIFPGKETHFNYHGFDWLRTSKNHKLEIDIWVPELKLAVEYDGAQHFQPVKFCSSMTNKEAEANLTSLQFRDARKNELIAAHPEEIAHFVRFSYKDQITLDAVNTKLKGLLPYDF